MASSSVLDDKLKLYKSLQGEIQNLYGQKQQSLSQLNENVIVKGVSTYLFLKLTKIKRFIFRKSICLMKIERFTN